jgi:hypothetical protein
VHPATESDDWWEQQRAVVRSLALAATRHTTTPQACWYGIWTGHGYDEGSLGIEHAQFHLPFRSYYLLRGDVEAATAIEWPGGRGGGSAWMQPDLWWPDDHSWFIATDVDVWSTYVGCSTELADEIAAAVPTATERVALGDHLPIED